MAGRTAPAEERRIVVGVDGSAGSRAALLWALPAAAARGARVEVLVASPVDASWTGAHLVDPRRFDALRSHTGARIRSTVAEMRRDLAIAGTAAPPADVLVVSGPAAERLVDRARGADLLVVGSRGRSGARSTRLGSVALHCAAHGPCPVVVVHPSWPAPTAPVVVGLDDTPAARGALRRAVDEAGRCGADVEVVAAFMPMSSWSSFDARTTEEPERTRARVERNAERVVAEVLGERAPAARPAVQVEVVEGWVTDVLIGRAQEARLLVVGSRSRSRLVGMALGSVALHCVVHAPCPVMVVHPEPAARAEAAGPRTAAAGGPMGASRSCREDHP